MSKKKRAKSAAFKTKSRPSALVPWWAIIAIVAGLALLAVVVLSSSPNTASTPRATIEVHGAPALKIDKDRVDFGNVKLGQTVQVSFDVTNVGDQLLRFSEQPYVEVVEGC